MRIGESGFRDGSLVLANAGSVRPPEIASHGTTASRDEPSAFEKVLRGLGKEVDQGERMVRRATSGAGADLGPTELLALQAGVYRYSEAVDLAAKLVDRATNGVKTVLQGQ